MKSAARTAPPRRPFVPRKTIYRLAPLELECMKVVWDQPQASVRHIRERLAAEGRPLAYTTVETIMDRLTRKGIVARQKVGKAHRYTPLYEKSAARVHAVAALVEHFFGGSRPALRAHLEGRPVAEAPRPLPAAFPSRAAEAAPRRAARSRDAKAEPPLDTTLL